MYGKLSITRFFWHSAIFCNFFCYQLRNIFFTQFGAVLRLMIDFTPCAMCQASGLPWRDWRTCLTSGGS